MTVALWVIAGVLLWHWAVQPLAKYLSEVAYWQAFYRMAKVLRVVAALGEDT